jgi:hypothetical protein
MPGMGNATARPLEAEASIRSGLAAVRVEAILLGSIATYSAQAMPLTQHVVILTNVRIIAAMLPGSPFRQWTLNRVPISRLARVSVALRRASAGR